MLNGLDFCSNHVKWEGPNVAKGGDQSDKSSTENIWWYDKVGKVS